jgi:hypothetical protein
VGAVGGHHALQTLLGVLEVRQGFGQHRDECEMSGSCVRHEQEGKTLP